MVYDSVLLYWHYTLRWSMIVCYFIGIIPLGGGVFTVENVDGYCSEVILQAIRVILLLATIEVFMSFCYS